jgi:hypothetical protein
MDAATSGVPALPPITTKLMRGNELKAKCPMHA